MLQTKHLLDGLTASTQYLHVSKVQQQEIDHPITYTIITILFCAIVWRFGQITFIFMNGA